MSISVCHGYKFVYSLFVSFTFSLLLATIGCGGTSAAATPGRTLLAVAASPASAGLSVGAAKQFTATATYSDGSTQDVTALATWTATSPKVATITASGMATALAAGSTTVTATWDGVSGSASLTVSAAAKTLTSIAITPATATIAIGANQQFTATATYSDSSTADVTASATWTSSNAAIAKIAPSGLASAVAAGSATVTATVSGVSANATVSVPAAAKTLSSVTISPATPSIAIGATQQFIATATYSDKTTADVTATATWTTSNPAVATVNAAGLATGVAAGAATVTATLSGVQSGAALTVTPSLTAVSISPTPASLNVGATQQFTATATYSDKTTADVTAKSNWTTSNPTVASINPSGVATAVASGSTTITASFGGMTGTSTLNVRALTTISISPATASFSAGSTQQFTATGTYSDGTTADVTSTSAWAVADKTVATISPSGLATGLASGSTSVTAKLGATTGTATLTVTALPTISVTPNNASLAVGATQQFTATATNPDGTTADVTATATWSIANTSVATINASGLATAVASGSTTVTAFSNGSKGTAPLTVTVPSPLGVNITTWHVDNNRSGLNPNETSLTPANVAPSTFGKLFSYLVDGYAYAEPLLMSNVTINGATHNVLYVATENDSVYAFDADKYGPPLWQVSLLNSGETPLTGASVRPNQGVTSTPVIDPATNTIYVVSAQKSSGSNASYRLNALDIATGSPKLAAVTIQASVPGTNSTAVAGTVSLPGGCVQRAALLLANGNVYLGFGSCHSGWLLAYDTKTLTQVGVFNSSPDLDGEGAYGGAGGVWMGSGGPIADAAGDIYVSTGNGPYDGLTAYGDSILKFDPSLKLLDHFTPEDFGFMNCNDSDLASGGLLMVPGSGQIVGGGKMGKLYLVNTANLGGEQPKDAGAAQTLFVEQGIAGSQPYPSSCTDSDVHGNPLPNGKTYYVGGPNDSNGDTNNGVNSYEIFGTSAYFNGSIYLGVTPTNAAAPGVVRQFAYAAPGVLTPTQEFTSLSVSQQQPLNTRGTTPFISANGTNDGILWVIDQGQPLQTPDPGGPTSATLIAYDAQNLAHELYDTNMNSADVPGYGIKFSSPVVANGKVYISTGHDPYSSSNPIPNPQGEIDVYGLK
jgi:uncharacterized protein YjdB